jgi:hypothetical protein
MTTLFDDSKCTKPRLDLPSTHMSFYDNPAGFGLNSAGFEAFSPPPPPPPAPSSIPVENLALSDLMRNPYVLNLVTDLQRATNHVVQSSETQEKLWKEVHRLKAELQSTCLMYFSPFFFPPHICDLIWHFLGFLEVPSRFLLPPQSAQATQFLSSPAERHHHQMALMYTQSNQPCALRSTQSKFSGHFKTVKMTLTLICLTAISHALLWIKQSATRTAA